MKRHITIFIVLFLVIALPFDAQSQQRLTFVTVDNFPPYAWRVGEEVSGIDVDIIRALSQRTGIPIKIELMPAKRLILMTQNGEADAAFAAFKTPERETFAHFIDTPLHYSTYQVFVRKGDEFSFEGIGDLEGKIIGKNRGFYINEEFSQAQVQKRIQVIEVSKMDQNINMLVRSRLDAFIGNTLEVAYILKKLDLSDTVVALPLPVLTPKGAHLMISKAAKIENKNEITRRLNETLHDMKQDGSLDAIYAEYSN